ncbi:hypothetical protein ACIQ6Y_31980 [Streptomyces sp. NPDC096205]|uniref:hypothetical protein n=1 Tax=Streptomyces sp. NPDC096205 TaxID=3366081 RepID=UPI00381B7556
MSWYRRFPAAIGAAAAFVTVLNLASCTPAPSSDERRLQEALKPLQSPGSFRMVGQFRAPDGATTPFDARLDGHGACKGTVGTAESVLVGQRVWTRWADDTLDDAVASLPGGSDTAADPTTPEEEDRAWAAVQMLRGTYMVTNLPGNVAEVEGIAPVCQVGQLLAGAATSAGTVIDGAAEERDGERLWPLTKTEGPVKIRVWIPGQGQPVVRAAEYSVEGGRVFSIRVSEIGEPVTVRPPQGQQAVTSEQVLAVLDPKID